MWRARKASVATSNHLPEIEWGAGGDGGFQSSVREMSAGVTRPMTARMRL